MSPRVAAVFLLLHLLLCIEIMQFSLLQVRGRLNSTSRVIQTLSFKVFFLSLMYPHNHLQQYGPVYLLMGNHFGYFLCPLKVHKCLGLWGRTKTKTQATSSFIPLTLTRTPNTAAQRFNSKRLFRIFPLNPMIPTHLLEGNDISQQIDLCGGWPNWRSESW